MNIMETELDRLVVLFDQQHYEEVVLAGQAAMKKIADTERRRGIQDLMCKSRLLQKIEAAGGDITTMLESKWYSNSIRVMINENRLKKIASVPVPMDGPFPDREDEIRITGFEIFAKTGCAIIMRIGGVDGSDWEGVRRESDSDNAGPGGERCISASVLRGSYMDQWTDGHVFLKDTIASFGCDSEEHEEGLATCVMCQGYPMPMYEFPVWSVQPISSVTEAEDRLLDVQFGTDLVSSSTHAALRTELDALGEKRRDSPAPKYHNIIDPNVGAVNDIWVPTEFDVTESPMVETVAMLERACEKATHGRNLPQDFMETAMKMHRPALARAEVRSPIPDLDPHENAELYVAAQDVMEAALPLLARMRNPALLLPGPLQAVIKAQRIVLKEGETYQGVWHEDGLRENVVAVVLYYYRVSPTLSGGDMEIVSKMRSALGVGDAGDFTEEEAENQICSLPRMKVPVQEGTLLVFGNYSALHRVLPMKATGGPGSRDFLAFFIIDQRVPLPMHLELGPLEVRKQYREKLLAEQLQPRGCFGLDGSEVYSTGNGDYIDIAWLKKGTNRGGGDGFEDEDDFFKISAMVSQMNISPPVLGRGLSFLAEYTGNVAEYNADSEFVQHIIGQGEDIYSVFVNTSTSKYRSTIPFEEGVRSVVVFDDVEKWQSLGLRSVTEP